MKHSGRGRSTHLWIVTTEPRPSNRLTVVVPQQISMSARCPPRVLGKRVQTQRVRSPVSTARTVTESLRMDSGATVRLLFVAYSSPGLAWPGLAWLSWPGFTCPGLAWPCPCVYVHWCDFLFLYSNNQERLSDPITIRVLRSRATLPAGSGWM